MLIWNPHESGDVYPTVLGSTGGAMPPCKGAPPLGITNPLPPVFMFGIYLIPLDKVPESDVHLFEEFVDDRLERSFPALFKPPFSFPKSGLFRTIAEAYGLVCSELYGFSRW
jgi:hypothetical protein